MTPTEGRAGGRLALVTGASGGIGRAVCATLAEAGHDLVLLYRRTPPTDLAASLGDQVRLTAALDLVDAAEVARQADSIVREAGDIDVLVHAA